MMSARDPRSLLYTILLTRPSGQKRLAQSIQIAQRRHQKPTKVTRRPEPANTAFRPAEPLGMLFVLAPPRYQLPMLVSFPFSVNMAALGPTFETLLRNAPK